MGGGLAVVTGCDAGRGHGGSRRGIVGMLEVMSQNTGRQNDDQLLTAACDCIMKKN